MKKFIFIPIYISALAFVIQIIDQFLSPVMPISPNSGFAWIAFQAWAMYFLAGCTVKGGIKSLIAYTTGIAASIVIILLATNLSGLGMFTVPLAIFIIVIPVIALEKANEYLSFIPGIFVGAGAFFGMMNYVDGSTFGTAAFVELVYCALGLTFGYITISIRSWYDKRIGQSAE